VKICPMKIRAVTFLDTTQSHKSASDTVFNSESVVIEISVSFTSCC
jgi:hypothetical protein